MKQYQNFILYKNIKILFKEKKINVSTFRNWLRTKTKTPISLIRETLQTWTKKQLQNGNKVTTKELMDKIKQNYPTILKHKKYNAKRMFVKRIIDNATL
jgi:arsenate reductase-like glutaredoxin family protein